MLEIRSRFCGCTYDRIRLRQRSYKTCSEVITNEIILSRFDNRVIKIYFHAHIVYIYYCDLSLFQSIFSLHFHFEGSLGRRAV